MSLVKWKNANDHALQTGRMFPSVFSDFFDGFFGNELLGGELVSWVPAVNISETDNSFKIDVSAPGLGKNDFKVEIDNYVLSVSGERKDVKNNDNSRYTRREFSYGSFRRSFNLPDIVDSDKIDAHFDNGVLTLTIPKKEEAKRKPVKEISIS